MLVQLCGTKSIFAYFPLIKCYVCRLGCCLVLPGCFSLLAPATLFLRVIPANMWEDNFILIPDYNFSLYFLLCYIYIYNLLYINESHSTLLLSLIVSPSIDSYYFCIDL